MAPERGLFQLGDGTLDHSVALFGSTKMYVVNTMWGLFAAVVC